MKSNMDELYTETMEHVMAAIHDHDCICVQCDSTGVKREQFAQRRDPSCAYELPEKWEGEPFPLPEGLHQTQQMYVLRDGDRVIGYFPRREDAEQRLLVDERVDGKAWVTVR